MIIQRLNQTRRVLIVSDILGQLIVGWFHINVDGNSVCLPKINCLMLLHYFDSIAMTLLPSPPPQKNRKGRLRIATSRMTATLVVMRSMLPDELWLIQ